MTIYQILEPSLELDTLRKRCSELLYKMESLLDAISKDEDGIEPYRKLFLCTLDDLISAWHDLFKITALYEHIHCRYGDRDICFTAGRITEVIKAWWHTDVYVSPARISPRRCGWESNYRRFQEEMQQALLERELTS